MIAIQKIREHALATPEKPALVQDGAAVDYRTFFSRIMAVRAFLQDLGVRAGSVGVAWVFSIQDGWIINLAMRSLGLTTLAAQSLLEAGQFDRVDLGCIVVSERDAPHPSPAWLNTPMIVVPLALLDAEPGQAELPASPETSLDGGHVLLTSGTTGVYKKIWLNPARLPGQVERRAQRLQETAPTGPGPGQRVVNLLNFGLWTYMGYGTPPQLWMSGSTVVVWQGAEPWLSLQWPGLTSTWTTPAFLRLLLSAPKAALTPLPDMQLYVVGGALSPALAHEARERITAQLFSVVGATEAGIWATTSIGSDDDLRLHRLTGRRPVEVVDADGVPVGPGQLGELRVKVGDDRPLQYFDDEEASARFFREGWFYPGDLAVLHADGRLSLHGRSTEVLAIDGDKLATEPFERDLRDRLGVADVCVFAMSSSQGDQLHVVLETDRDLERRAVDEAMNAVLYGFGKAILHVVPHLPRNHMGKVERLKLKQMLMAQGR